jgi:hypothetical protein
MKHIQQVEIEVYIEGMVGLSVLLLNIKNQKD